MNKDRELAAARKKTIVSLVRIGPEEARLVRDCGDVDLIEAGGWFDGEYAGTWPRATVQRYVAGSGHGTRSERDALLAAAQIVIGGFPFPLDLCARAPKLEWLHQTPAGASNLMPGDIWGQDLIVTTSRGGGEVLAIAEYAMAGLLHFAKAFDQAASDRESGLFDHSAYRITALTGKTLCVIGAGGIGREVARLGAALGMRVIGTRRTLTRTAADRPFDRLEPPAALHDQLADADFVAVCCQWTPETTGLLDVHAFAALRPGAVIVNVARGEIIDEDALAGAIANGTVRGAVLDVYRGEFEHPPPARLWQHPNVLITPHTSNKTDTSQRRSMQLFRENLARFRDGQPLLNRVDWLRGY